jgi:hypothetical protein
MKKVIFAAALLAMISLSGCQCAEKSSIDPDSHLPAGQYFVGGGFNIDFVAPSDGTAYLVMRNQKKIVQTKPLKQGEHFTFSSSVQHPESFNEFYFGVPAKDAVIELYFVPATAMNNEQ